MCGSTFQRKGKDFGPFLATSDLGWFFAYQIFSGFFVYSQQASVCSICDLIIPIPRYLHIGEMPAPYPWFNIENTSIVNTC